MGMMAWDKRTGEIVYCLPRTSKSNRYTKKQWAFVFDGNPDYPEHIQTSDNGPDMVTSEAQNVYRVIDGELLPKPKPLLAATKAIEGTPCEIMLDFEHLLPEEKIKSLNASIKGEGLSPVGVILEKGVNEFIFDILGELMLEITDKRVQTAKIELEVLPGEGNYDSEI